MTTLLPFRTSTYARNLYYFGSTSFTKIPVEYHEAVKQFGAANYTNEQLKAAYDKGYINNQEFNDTMAYKQQPVEPTE